MPILDRAASLRDTDPPDAEVELVEEITRLVLEATDARQSMGPGGMSLEEVWERNGRRYVGDHWDTSSSLAAGVTAHVEETGIPHPRTTPGFARYTINRTQGAVISQKARAFGRPETFRFEPIETEDETMLFIKPVIGETLVRGIKDGSIPIEGTGLQGFKEGQLRGEEPIPQRFEENLLATQLFREQDFFRVNDTELSRAVQTVWDTLYSRVKGSYYVAMNSLYTGIFGFQPLLFEWDEELPGFKLSNPHILNCWIDPSAETVEDAEYFVMDFTISKEHAQAAFPKLREAIEEAATSGQLKRHGELRESTKVTFRRDMVVVRTAWIRHRRVDMTIDEAEASDLVRSLQGQNGSTSYAKIGVKGEPVRTKPGDSNWPKKIGLRQVQVLPQINRRISDIRCPYWDIPIAWNKNIPVPYSPYGQGEPERLESIQQAINRLFTILHRHARFYQAPMEFWPEDLYNDVRAKGGEPYAEPGRIIPVRYEIFELLTRLGGSGGFGIINAIPPIPSFYVGLLELLLVEHDRLSGFQDVLQGASPGAETSGRAIEALQAAALGPIEVKSFATELALERIGEIGLDAIRKWLPEAVWAKILNQYPLPVLRFIRDQIDLREFNVKVSLISGKGISEAFDAEKAAVLYMEGNPARLVSRETAMRLSSVPDPPAEERRIERENREQFSGITQASSVPSPGGGNGSPNPGGARSSTSGRTKSAS
jgi:hypothetical protein